MYLVDTNVISALAPTKASTSEDLAGWLDRQGDKLFLSVVTAAEIISGIARAERMGAEAKASRLREWWETIEHLYASRLLPIDLRVAHLAGLLLDGTRAHDPGFEDIAIAATAKVHGLTVLTRNLRHFRPLGVTAVDPFESLPNL